MWHTLLYIRAQACARKHIEDIGLGAVTCDMGRGFGVLLGRLALVELVYSVACEGQGLLIEGKARGAWCCVAVCGGERWFMLIIRRRVVVALLFALQSVVGVVFLFVCATHAEA